MGYFAIHAVPRPEIPRPVISAVIVAVIRISMTKNRLGCIFAPRMVIAATFAKPRAIFFDDALPTPVPVCRDRALYD
jgi:hypothetical protein